MNAIQSFNFESQTVRTATNPQGEIYFCLPDVSAILAIKNGRDTIAKLDEKGVEKIYTPTKGGTQEITFINEPNLYRVIFRSNKAEAVKFQNWVFDEVLPSIRKTGSYTANRHTISVEQQSAIRLAVAKRCKSESVHYATIYEALKKRFDIPRYTELLACDFDEAMALIASIELNAPQIAHNQSYLTQKDAVTLAKVMDYARLYAEFGETIGTEKGRVSVATLYSKNAHDDDDGFFVCYRPKYKQDIDQALTLFRKIAQDSLLN